MNIFTSLGLFIFCFSILVSNISAQTFLKVYPYQNVCVSDNSNTYELTKFTKDEILEKCKNSNFAQITESCENGRGKVLCCDEISSETTVTNFVQISTKPNFEEMCEESLWTDKTYGAFTDRRNSSLSTLYINDKHRNGQK